MSFLKSDKDVLLDVVAGLRWFVRQDVSKACVGALNAIYDAERAQAHNLSLLTSAQINLDEALEEVKKLRREKYEAESRANQLQTQLSHSQFVLEQIRSALV